ncbi:chromosome segregation protein SMC [Heliorestis acidaminivorans]|uniref:chromosome segregation protein SMC n=1 Tax=Heliorestis acidaminivorans TaxID=553427 RepID=UPI00147928AD|nr:chromosome segregation protein SMC [Heliorestis acidaminivorans]
MVLKRIELNGFKSFADKTEILLSPGVTVIVGPNGSGKSNVSDAIRWVLGEQSARSLRGSKMEDIIFAGSERRKPVGMAEVSIHVDNDQGLLPLDYREVLVTRRVYRSGESDFLLNRSTCRLRDIHELFADTGLGREGISIIGQGRVDEVLSSRPEDRRTFIEEAAGIVKYRNRKNEALKKMEDTQNHIIRVEDIIDELEKQYLAMTEQAAKARLYQELEKKINQLEQRVALTDYKEVKIKKAQLQQSYQKQQEGLLGKESAFVKFEQEESTLSLQLKKAEEALSTIRQEKQAQSEQLLKLKNELALLEERSKGLKAQKEMLQKELSQNQETLTEILRREENDLAKESKVNKRLQTLDHELKDQQKLGESSRAQVFQIEQKITEVTLRAQKRDEEAEVIQRQLHEIEIALTRQEEQSKTLEESISFSLARMAEWEEEYSRCQEEQEKVVQKAKRLEEEAKQTKEKLTAIQIKGEDIENKLTETMRRWQEISARIKALEHMERSYEGFNKGVKEIMTEAKKHQSSLQGICGLISELIEVPLGLEIAYQVALGSSMQNIVVEDDRSAQIAIEFLKKYKKGRATFLPLKSLQVYTGPGKEFLQEPGVIGCAADLIQFDKRYDKAVRFLLGRTLIFEDLTRALAFARQKKSNYKLVTLDGEILQPGGTVTGGTLSPQGGQTFLRRRELTMLKEEERKLSLVIASLKQSREEVREEQQKTAEQSMQLEKDLTALQFDRSSKDAEMLGLQKSLARERQQIEERLKEQGNCQETMTRLYSDRNRLEGKIKNLFSLKKELEQTYQELKKQIEELRKKGDDENKVLTERQLERARLEEEQKSLAVSLQILRESKAKLHEEAEQKKEKDQEWAELLCNYEKRAQELEAKVFQGILQEETLVEQTKQCQQVYDSLREEVEVLLNKKKPLLAEITALNKELHQIEIALTKVETEEKALLLKFQEKWAITDEAVMTQAEEDEIDRKAYQKEIATAKISLKELGTVNMLAIEEEKNLQERISFLHQQHEDLKAAQDSLEQVITEIEEIMIQRFGQAFDEINEHFRYTFSELFQGGQAELILTDPDNLLETGIDMVAQPPGKKRVPLSLLSGGERALTAIALLFALLKTRPSPFCVLDEIEAALDEANVSRFANYLKKLSQKSQFIVISHRKGTMEAADYLYGVTMEEGGVSKLISVKMTDRDDGIDAVS